MEIINLGQKMGASWEGNFPLDCLGTKEYFVIVVSIRS